MRVVTLLDYEILKRIPLYPAEKTRGKIVEEIKQAYPTGKYNKLTTNCFDAVLMKYTRMFQLIEDKEETDMPLFPGEKDDAPCLQSTLEPIDLEWVLTHIGDEIEVEEDDEFID